MGDRVKTVQYLICKLNRKLYEFNVITDSDNLFQNKNT